MPNVMGVLRAEIRRLARKETKQEMGELKKQLTVLRRRLAEWNRRMQGVEARARQILKNGSRGAGRRAGSDEGDDEKQIRFSAAWVRAHRKKLGMSRQLYARLVGVSAQTIMGWEAGRTRPRRAALRNWRAIRGKGLRELRAMLGGGEGAGVGRGARGRRRAVRKAARKAGRRARARVKQVRRTIRRARVVRAARAGQSARGRRARAAKRK